MNLNSRDFMVICCMCSSKHIVRNVSQIGGTPAKFLNINQFRQLKAMEMTENEGWKFYPRVEKVDTWEALCPSCILLFEELGP